MLTDSYSHFVEKAVIMSSTITMEANIMSTEVEVYERLAQIGEAQKYSTFFGENSEQAQKLAEHKAWLQNIRHERPNTAHHYRVGIYIRYYNQTKYDNYLEKHLQEFNDTMALCPNWELVDFYIDEGATAPNMESAKEWSRLLQDCLDGKIDLIITQKVKNVSKKPHEITYLARILSRMNPPVGMYFISEDIFTLASYYQSDRMDEFFLPSPDWKLLPDDLDEGGNPDD